MHKTVNQKTSPIARMEDGREWDFFLLKRACIQSVPVFFHACEC